MTDYPKDMNNIRGFFIISVWVLLFAAGGSGVCETNNLGQGLIPNPVSPWIGMNGNDQIVFTHAWTANNGTRVLKVFLVSYPALSEELNFIYNYPGAGPVTSTVTHSKKGIYKVNGSEPVLPATQKGKWTTFPSGEPTFLILRTIASRR